MIKEKIIKGSIEPVNIASTEKILNQMKNSVCKIKIKNEYATGFFCKIPNMNCLMTNYHVIDEKYINENKEINLLLNDDKETLTIDLEIKREKYFNKEYDITLIELKEKDKIKEYLELDDNLFKNNDNFFYEQKSIYILHYMYGKNICVSYGLLSRINNYDIIHICSTNNGSSGSPIINLENNKVIGIHKEGSINCNFNKGTILSYPLNDFIKKDNKNNISKDNNITPGNNVIKGNSMIIGEISINTNDINKNIKIINSYENYMKENSKNKLKEEYKNEKEIKENVEIKINEKLIEFTYNYKFKQEGKYKIEYLFKNNLPNICYMFCDCKSLIKLNLSNFNTKNVINMLGMFYNCSSLTDINLSNINTKNVTNMAGMFGNCISLTNLNLLDLNTENVTNMLGLFQNCKSITNLNLSNFNTRKVTNMSSMFCYCYSLTNLNLENFNTKNIAHINGMFKGCNSLKKDNIITKDDKILKEFEIK